ncbi:MAG: C-terminal helicase domain-containing protein, partial [Candidatus Coproplasma sp.]
DCISEGQNLQDCDICINYDIHWNPVRIVQRFGRIDRIGSRNEKIQLVNFWPDISLDEYINLNKRVSARMTIVNATATADDNIISDEDEEMDYRKEQLKKLQEGTLQDLEDVDGNISITDLGLNDFIMDLHNYVKERGEPKGITTGLHAVVSADASKGVDPGIIFVLRNRNNGVNINKQNRLHPYYLVYLKENGEVVYNHLDVKSTLDVLRTTSKGRGEPIAELCRKFNKETKDGLKMDKYNALLDDAVASIIEVKEENDLQSLFKSGSKVLFQQRIDGLDDFELISFVVIK